MAPSETTRRLSAIFMADVVGYSRLRSEQADVGPYRVHLTNFYPLHHKFIPVSQIKPSFVVLRGR